MTRPALSVPPVSRRSLIAGSAAFGLAACTNRLAGLPKADGVVIQKSQRKLFLTRNSMAMAIYAIDLGFEPRGHKVREGDGRTPEGQYWIDRKNPESSFHLSLGISYPNPEDIARARAAGENPGGDIFIHGRPNGRYDRNDPDWTAGCIAVTNREIEEIYWMVPVGTPILLMA